VVLRKEPVFTVLASVDVVVVAVLSMLSAFGVVDLSGEQLAAISAAVVAVSGFAAGVLRQIVVAPDTHEREVLDAWVSPGPSFEDFGDV